jgi:ribosomal protein S10
LRAEAAVMSVSGGPRAASRLNLVVRSHDKDILNAFLRMLPVGGAGKGVVRLPTKTKTWTVNKSPHVHGKAKESFRRFMHRVLIPIEAPNHVTLRWITAIRDAGVTAKVSFKLEVSGGGRATNEKDGKRGIDKDRVRYNDKYLRDRAAGNLEGMQVLARDRWAQRNARRHAAGSEGSTEQLPKTIKYHGAATKQLLRELQAQAVYQQSLPEASAAQQARLERWQQELSEWHNQHAWESSYRYLQRRAEWEKLLLERLIAAEQQQQQPEEEQEEERKNSKRSTAKRSSAADNLLYDSASDDLLKVHDDWSDFFEDDDIVDGQDAEGGIDDAAAVAAAAAAAAEGEAAFDSDDDTGSNDEWGEHDGETDELAAAAAASEGAAAADSDDDDAANDSSYESGDDWDAVISSDSDGSSSSSGSSGSDAEGSSSGSDSGSEDDEEQSDTESSDKQAAAAAADDDASAAASNAEPVAVDEPAVDSQDDERPR